MPAGGSRGAGGWSIRGVPVGGSRDDARTCSTSRRGGFEIDGLVEGEWTLEAFRGGGCCAGPYEEFRLGTVASGARGLEFRLAK